MSDLELSPLQREISTGEKLLWTGRPRQGLVLRPTDAFMIPFSLLWAGFAVFWETTVVLSGGPFFFMLWGIPFVLMGAYITVGRFFVDAYLRSKTYYGVTNERAIIVAGLLSQTVKSLNLRSSSDITMEQKGDGSGSISFGPMPPYAAWQQGMVWPGTRQPMPPQFEMIPDVKQVYELLRQAQQGR